MFARPRGRLAVLERAVLERRACECYAVVKKEFGRLLSAAPAQRSMFT